MINQKSIDLTFESAPINPEHRGAGAYAANSVEEIDGDSHLLHEADFIFDGGIGVIATQNIPRKIDQPAIEYGPTVFTPTPHSFNRTFQAQDLLASALTSRPPSPEMEIFAKYALDIEGERTPGNANHQKLVGGLAVGRRGNIATSEMFLERTLITSVPFEATKLKRAYHGRSDDLCELLADYYQELATEESDPLESLARNIIGGLPRSMQARECIDVESGLKGLIGKTILSAKFTQPDEIAFMSGFNGARGLSLVGAAAPSRVSAIAA